MMRSDGGEIRMADETRPRTPISADWVLKRIQNGKKVRLKNAAIEGDLDIKKLGLPTQHIDRTELQKQRDLKEDVNIVNSFINIVNSTIQGALDFSNSTFSEFALFRGVTFSNNAWFYGATFCCEANFEGATFKKSARFSDATFSMDAVFNLATFDGAGFDGTTFSMDAFFGGTTFSMAFFNSATFGSEARFQGATFGGAWFRGATFKNAWFYKTTFDGRTIFEGAVFGGSAIFEGATFEDARFNEAKFEGDVLTFRDAAFLDTKDQEDACRKAKNVLEKNGDREEAGYHFYREMDGKRKQKKGYIRYPEFLFLQLIFGYGVHPWRLMYWWLLIIIIFSNIYLIGNGIDGIEHWYDYIKISFAIGIAPGYIAAIINPASAGYKLIPMYQVVAIIETIVGTFLWAGFIATFAKKYMR